MWLIGQLECRSVTNNACTYCTACVDDTNQPTHYNYMSTFNIRPQNVIATEHLYYDNPGIMTKITQWNRMEVLFTHGRSRASYVAGKRQQCRDWVSLTSAEVQYSLFQSPLPYTEPVTFSQDNLKPIKPSNHHPLNVTDWLKNAWIWKMYEYAIMHEYYCSRTECHLAHILSAIT